MRRLIYMMILGFVMISCNKNTLPDAPDVYLLAPAVNQVINIPDSVYISFTVNSSQEIKSVRVSIDNSNQVPVSIPSSYNPNSKEFEISDYIIVETVAQEVLIPPYYVNILVDNGEYSFHYFSQVSLIPKEVYFAGHKAFSQSSNNSIVVEHYDMDGSIIGENEIQGVFVDSEVSNLYGLFYVATKNPEKIQAYDIESNDLIWEKEGILPYPEINKLKIRGNLIYQSMNIGRITGMLLTDGTNKVITPTLPDTTLHNLCITDNFIFSDYILRNNSKRGFYSFYASAGDRFGRFIKDFETQAIYENNDNPIIFGNSISAHILDFDIINSQILKEYELSDYNIDKVCQIDINTYIFSDGAKIAIFDRSSGTAETIYVADYYISDIKYEYLSQYIYLVSENALYIITKNGTEVTSINASNNLMAIELLYEQ